MHVFNEEQRVMYMNIYCLRREEKRDYNKSERNEAKNMVRSIYDFHGSQKWRLTNKACRRRDELSEYST
jgi:hypothetical protein